MCWSVSAGALNVFLHQKGPTVTETPVWSLSGNQGDHWLQAKVNIHPTAAFQVRPGNTPALGRVMDGSRRVVASDQSVEEWRGSFRFWVSVCCIIVIFFTFTLPPVAAPHWNTSRGFYCEGDTGNGWLCSSKNIIFQSLRSETPSIEVLLTYKFEEPEIYFFCGIKTPTREINHPDYLMNASRRQSPVAVFIPLRVLDA